MKKKNDTDDQKHLREVVSAEIKAIMDKHEVGGAVLLASRESASWLTVFPVWSGLQLDPVHGMRLRINSKTPESQAVANATMGLIMNIREMCSDYANLYGRLFRQAKDALAQQGSTIEHTSFEDGEGRPDPMGGRVE